jgi:hypothetical protein
VLDTSHGAGDGHDGGQQQQPADELGAQAMRLHSVAVEMWISA